jgi:ParB family transcriptional regulator, chromosome partitioning protein
VVTDTQELDGALAAVQPGAEVPVGEMPARLVLVDPRSLVVDANVRSEVLLDRAFVASVRDLGVLVPISARRCEGGVLKVVLGQRRTLAAVEAGRELVPVFVIDAPDEEKAAEIARIVEQVVENDLRAALPDADRVGAFEQLSLLGLSAAQIARRTRTPVRAVRTALEVTGSAVAAGAMRRHDLTLEQAAVIAEFDGDSEAVEALTAAVQREPERFEHVVQRLRDDRVERLARAQVAESVGVPIVDQPGYGSSSPVQRLTHLKPAAQPDGTELSVQAHSGCPGHAAYIVDRGSWSAQRWDPVYVCTDWQQHGHEPRYADADRRTIAGQTMTEEQRAERRLVIENNRAWESAQIVRRRWLREFLGRRSAPKDAPQWVAATVAAGSFELQKALEDGFTVAIDLLGLATEPQWRRVSGATHPVAEAAVASTAARASVLTLGLLLGGIEAGTGRHSWRRPTATARSYFATLERWGYVLSDVERLVLADPDAGPEPDAGTDAGTDAEKADRPAVGEQPHAATADNDIEGAAERVA